MQQVEASHAVIMPPDTPRAPNPAEEKYAGCSELVITTPNAPTYAGTTFGVRFHEGHALINRSTPNRFGWTLEQLGAKFDTELIGYHVEASWYEQVTRPVPTAPMAAILTDPNTPINKSPTAKAAPDPAVTAVGRDQPKEKKARSARPSGGRPKVAED